MANNYMFFSELYTLTDKQKPVVQKIIDAHLDKYEFCMEITEDGLWIYSEESFDIANVVELIQMVQKTFDHKRPFIISFAETCSKPRLGEFGGGAVIITEDVAEYINARRWAEDKAVTYSNKY